MQLTIGGVEREERRTNFLLEKSLRNLERKKKEKEES
jgi:hypothetical protein